MSIFAVSDLHISSPEDPLYLKTIFFIQKRLNPGDILVLAGDIFDFFVGGKKFFIHRYCLFLEALDFAVKKGVQVHYIEGNHDFLLENTFKKNKGVHLHTESLQLEVSGKVFFFAHGDLINKKDYWYMGLRFFLRSRCVRWFIFLVPGKWVYWIGEKASQMSLKRHSPKTSFPERQAQEVKNFENLRKLYRSYAAEKLAQGNDFVVLGHCHDLDEMTFYVGERFGQYINIGYPRLHGSLVSWTSGEKKIFREKLSET